MLDVQSVFEKVKQICPSVDESIMPFCENAAAVINGKIRVDVDASDVRLLTAAAAVAYCDYLMVHSISDSDVSYFRAGDITVRKGTSSVPDAVVRFRDMALSDVAALLDDSDFDFRAV